MAEQQDTLLQRIAQALGPDMLHIVYNHVRVREVGAAQTWHQLMAWCTALDEHGVRRGLEYPECDVAAAYKRMFCAAPPFAMDEDYGHPPGGADATLAHLFLGKPTWDDFQRRGRGDEFLLSTPAQGMDSLVYDYDFAVGDQDFLITLSGLTARFDGRGYSVIYSFADNDELTFVLESEDTFFDLESFPSTLQRTICLKGQEPVTHVVSSNDARAFLEEQFDRIAPRFRADFLAVADIPFGQPLDVRQAFVKALEPDEVLRNPANRVVDMLSVAIVQAVCHQFWCDSWRQSHDNKGFVFLRDPVLDARCASAQDLLEA